MAEGRDAAVDGVAQDGTDADTGAGPDEAAGAGGGAGAGAGASAGTDTAAEERARAFVPAQAAKDRTARDADPAGPGPADSPGAGTPDAGDSGTRGSSGDGSTDADTGLLRPGGPDDPARRARRRRRTRRVLLGAVILLCTGVLAVAGTAFWAYEHYTGRVQRIANVFPTGVPKAALPPPSKDGSQTFLLVGVDSRSDLPTTGKDAKAPEWRPGAQRSDTMMLVHLPADHRHAYVVSLPRDSWVDIPGHGRAKLNAAFSWGGPPLLIDTVQRLTRVTVDHLVVIDWSGFRKLTDAVGGVDITVDKTVERSNGAGGYWTAGTHHMSGADGLDYVRERYGLPRGDLDRTHRQQNFLRAVLSKMLSGGTFSNPLKLKRTLDQVTSVVSVDDRLSDADLRELVWKMRGVRSSDMVFMNAPVAGFDTIAKQSVVLLDPSGTSQLWEALRNDTMGDYVATHTLDGLGDKVS